MKKLNKKMLLDLKHQIYNEIGEVLTINTQNFSINGSVMFNNKKCFFKIIDGDNFLKEINGYFACNGNLPINNIVFTKKLSSKMYIILYEFDKIVTENSGLLNDILVENDKSELISEQNLFYLNNVLSVYDTIYSKKTVNLDKSANDIFFIERINTRLKVWYKDLIKSNKKIIINNNINVSISDILSETIHYFEESNIIHSSVLTQGDPNTLNISIKPSFFDLVTAGYNSIVSEVAITIISTLLYDNYFCPHYHPNSYGTHVQAINNYHLFKPNLTFDENDDELVINSNIITSNIRKKYVLDYINILKKNNIIINSEIKYYIVMRLMCVFNINTMEKSDYYYSLFLICYFYSNITDDFYGSVTNIVQEMGVLKYD